MTTPDDATVLVTGAAGFIGAHTALALLREGRRVLALDCLDDFYDPALKRANLHDLRAAAPSPAALSIVHLDIRDEPAIRDLLLRERPAALIHLAARAGVRPSIEQPALYADVNVRGTAALLDAAHAAGVRRVVLASSSSVYGDAATPPFREDDPCLHPISPYAATKRACELLALTHHHLTGMPTACLRFFTAYGPRQRPDLAVAKFLRLVALGQPVPVFGDGSMQRDYTYIDDIVAGVLAAERRIPEHGYRVWNLGNSRPVRLDDMLRAIERAVGKPADLRRLPPQPGDVRLTCADVSRAAAELDWRPRTPFQEGLDRQWAWTRRALSL